MALFHILIDVCRVLVNVALLLRTCTKDDFFESGGNKKQELYFNSCSGLIHHFKRQFQFVFFFSPFSVNEVDGRGNK